MSDQPLDGRGKILDLRPHLRELAEQQSIADEMQLGMILQAIYEPAEVNRIIAERREREADRLKALGDDHGAWEPPQTQEPG